MAMNNNDPANTATDYNEAIRKSTVWKATKKWSLDHQDLLASKICGSIVKHVPGIMDPKIESVDFESLFEQDPALLKLYKDAWEKGDFTRLIQSGTQIRHSLLYPSHIMDYTAEHFGGGNHAAEKAKTGGWKLFSPCSSAHRS